MQQVPPEPIINENPPKPWWENQWFVRWEQLAKHEE